MSLLVNLDVLSLIPSVHDEGKRQWKERLVSAVCTCAKISQKSGKQCYSSVYWPLAVTVSTISHQPWSYA